MEERVIKEKFVGRGYLPDFDPATYTDPILEECYRIKREYGAQFKNAEEHRAYVIKREIENRKKERKYVPIPAHLARFRHQEDVD